MSKSAAMILFDTVWDELDLGDATPKLAFDATITARTFAAAAPQETSGRVTLPAPKDDLPLPVAAVTSSIPTLPRISLARGGAAASPVGLLEGTGDRADLELLGTLGEGGMGTVYLARQRSLRRDVAVKTARTGVTEPELLDALLHEAITMGLLEHPSIIPVHALGLDDDDRPILVMKRVEGVSLSELLDNRRHASWAKRGASSLDRLDASLQIVMQVCNAVAFAHSRGVAHRDIKPANIMVGDFGEVYLVDWGIATKIQREPSAAAQGLRGTPAYMAPEMVARRGAIIDERTDVYLIGATLHEVLIGGPPHRGATLREVLEAAYQSRPFTYDPLVPAELAAIVSRAMSADPGRRYATAVDLRTAIGEFMRHRGSVALSATAAARLAEIRAALAAKSSGSFDAERFDRLATECRFGFMQAQRDWEENPSAREGLAGCLEAMIERHIAEGSAAAARGLLGEMPSRRPDLEERIEALEADIKRRREEEERLRQFWNDMDVSIGARWRNAVVFAFAVLSIVIGVVFVATGSSNNLGYRELFALVLTMLATLTVILIVFRRRLLQSTVSRRMFALLYTSLVVVLAHRVLSAIQGIPARSVVAGDTLILVGLACTAAITLLRWLWIPAAVFGMGTIAMVVWPELSGHLFTLSALVSTVLSLLAARWHSKAER